jgi:phosphoribosylformylglycinamidine synthase subunit PurL
VNPIAVDARKLREVALTAHEYSEIVNRLGREPNDVELGMLGVLWSEHCSYKTSKPLLRQLPTEGPRVLQGPGENAGAVDIGEGWAVVFKVESHNHPSAIEPYQGAATGVGGILRDVIAMGARPIALLDSLRFGPLPESRHHFEGVVAGVGGYGNCVGVPTVGGDVYFDESYAGNPLVNAMCVGLVRVDKLKRARAEGAGNRLLLVGADTGRDGIHGASFASLDLDGAAVERRPAVQVGNPFLEKCLIEACVELLDRPGVVAIQDLGAAGLTSAVAEVAARAAAGARLDVAAVPRRERGMTPYEVMLSESQERMLIVAERGRERELAEVFARWDLAACIIGEVTADGQLVVLDRLEEVARLPVKLLTEGAPVRLLEARQPSQQSTFADLDRLITRPADLGAVLVKLMGSPNLGSRRPIFRRYDHMVGDATVLPPGGDAAVLRVQGSRLGLALTMDGNGRYCRLDPYTGGQIAVAEAARNLVAAGARPLAVTDCLNFGNPERPEVYWQLREAIAGISAACRALGVPVVSGNVSLYNESDDHGSIDPTPVIGMVGLMRDYGERLDPAFKADGDFVLLVGETGSDLGGSEYLRVVHDQKEGRPPAIHIERELAAQEFILAAAAAGLLRSAHDVAEGGMLVALAECCLLGGRGVRCGALRSGGEVRLDALFFGESQGRFIVSARPGTVPELQALARLHHVELDRLGMTGGDAVEFDGQLRVGLAELRDAWASALL